jgi:hypothetical protein
VVDTEATDLDTVHNTTANSDVFDRDAGAANAT